MKTKIHATTIAAMLRSRYDTDDSLAAFALLQKLYHESKPAFRVMFYLMAAGLEWEVVVIFINTYLAARGKARLGELSLRHVLEIPYIEAAYRGLCDDWGGEDPISWAYSGIFDIQEVEAFEIATEEEPATNVVHGPWPSVEN